MRLQVVIAGSVSSASAHGEGKHSPLQRARVSNTCESCSRKRIHSHLQVDENALSVEARLLWDSELFEALEMLSGEVASFLALTVVDIDNGGDGGVCTGAAEEVEAELGAGI